jgi:hypothetical protein
MRDGNRVVLHDSDELVRKLWQKYEAEPRNPDFLREALQEAKADMERDERRRTELETSEQRRRDLEDDEPYYWELIEQDIRETVEMLARAAAALTPPPASDRAAGPKIVRRLYLERVVQALETLQLDVVEALAGFRCRGDDLVELWKRA